MIEIEKGPTPELAVMIVFPSGLNTNPNGWGATIICLPRGVIMRPLGIIVSPSFLICVNAEPAGAEATQIFVLSFLEGLQEESRAKNKNRAKG